MRMRPFWGRRRACVNARRRAGRPAQGLEPAALRLRAVVQHALEQGRLELAERALLGTAIVAPDRAAVRIARRQAVIGAAADLAIDLDAHVHVPAIGTAPGLRNVDGLFRL